MVPSLVKKEILMKNCVRRKEIKLMPINIIGVNYETN